MSNLKKTSINRGFVISFSVLLFILVLFILFYFLKDKNKEIINTNSGVLLESNTGTLETGSGTGPGQPITLDSYIQKIDDTDIDKALKLALKRFNENDKKDLGDYEQLTYIYIDKGDYDEAIKLGNDALDIINKSGINENGINHAIISQLAQAYIYNGDIEKAGELIKNNENLDFFIEKIMYEYKKSNNKYIIDNLSKLEETVTHDLFGFILLAKAYKNEKDINNSLKIYEKLFNDGKELAKNDSIFEVYYCYISSYILINEFNKNLNEDMIKYYTEQNSIYKKRIDNKEKIEYTDSDIDLYYNPDLMYFNINRIINF